MKQNTNHDAENTAAHNLVLQIYTVVSDLMNSDYIEMLLFSFVVKNQGTEER